MGTELLALGTPGSSLCVTVSPVRLRRPLAAHEEPTFDAVFEVDAHPFSGTLREVLVLSDLRAWQDTLADARPPADLILGGGRAAELRLHVEVGSDGCLAVEVRLRRSGDDPWPEIRYLVFGVEPFADHALDAVASVLGGHS